MGQRYRISNGLQSIQDIRIPISSAEVGVFRRKAPHNIQYEDMCNTSRLCWTNVYEKRTGCHSFLNAMANYRIITIGQFTQAVVSLY